MENLVKSLKEYQENHLEHEGMYLVLYLDNSGRLYNWENEVIFEFSDKEQFLKKLKA